MLRITSGKFRNRILKTSSDRSVRPTLAKLRAALFNSIQAHVPEARVLDLFAGSGALGFEALSRGAQFVQFVEASRHNAVLIGANAETLGVSDQIEIEVFRVEKFLQGPPPEPFDLIVADPPYGEGYERVILEALGSANWLVPEGLCILEGTSRDPELPLEAGCLKRFRSVDYGESRLTHYAAVGEKLGA